ncbi:MAG: YafY family transcriptional regulator [Paracoccaceae bacterium]|nr:MAG: YafY family transcriptional regulator [Paracoccaceae bacterium]
MPQTTRLFDLIQILRDGRLHTARAIADRLEVSTRTVWRDMARLQAAGWPVEGERGLGYMLRESVDLPPLTLTVEEIEALRLGAALVARGADPGLARAAGNLTAKIVAALPPRLAAAPGPAPFVYTATETETGARHLAALRRAVRDGLATRIDYCDETSRATARDIRPLQLEFWGRVWTLAAFCDLRGDFRSFRLDRIADCQVHDHPFVREPGRDLAAWQARSGPAVGLQG